MTLREQIADWISGGAITRARNNAGVLRQRYDERHFALYHIAEATAGTRNGTGKMVHRMAREALASI